MFKATEDIMGSKPVQINRHPVKRYLIYDVNRELMLIKKLLGLKRE